jgi:carbon storage regulator
MLVLSRKLKEKLMLSGGITVTVLEVHKDRVRLGIEAPRTVTIDREEVAAAKKRQQKG